MIQKTTLLFFLLSIGVAIPTLGQEKFVLQLKTIQTDAPYFCFQQDLEKTKQFLEDYTEGKNKMVEGIIEEHQKSIPNFRKINAWLLTLDSARTAINDCLYFSNHFVDEPLTWLGNFPKSGFALLGKRHAALKEEGSLKSKREAIRVSNLVEEMFGADKASSFKNLDDWECFEPIEWAYSSTLIVDSLKARLKQEFLVDFVLLNGHTKLETYASFGWDTVRTKERIKFDLKNQIIGDIGMGDTTYSIYDDIAASLVLHNSMVVSKGQLKTKFKDCPRCRVHRNSKSITTVHERQWISKFEGDQNILKQNYPGIPQYEAYPPISTVVEDYLHKTNVFLLEEIRTYLYERGLGRNFREVDFE
ncbi:MAG: hypothetical protein ACJAY8_000635 [Sphingobacteriales bacterium]|jgi:hypothetical protein